MKPSGRNKNTGFLNNAMETDLPDNLPGRRRKKEDLFEK